MKKVFAVLFSGVLLASSIPLYDYVKADEIATNTAMVTKEEVPAASGKTDSSDYDMEAAIKAVKARITIPKEYSEFDYYFYDTSSYYEAFWSFTWRIPGKESYIQVNCDVDNHITQYSKYDYSKENEAGLANYLQNELVKKAENFIEKIAPETKGKLELVNSTYEGAYSGNYSFQFQRIENGIPFPDNGVNVQVNNTTGEVMGVSINWLYGIKIPSHVTSLSKEEAIKIIKENMKMKLTYQTDSYWIYDKLGNASNSSLKKAYLVYEPTEYYISVDANSGKVYLTQNEWVDAAYGSNLNSKAKNEAARSADTGTVSMELSADELKKVEELKNLITKSEAIKKVTGNKYLLLDKNLKEITASLNKWDNGDGDTSYVWNIELRDPRSVDYEKDKDTYRAYAYATVDAKTGMILSYYASVKSYYNDKTQKWESVKIAYNKEEGKEILEKFLKSQIKNRLENSVLSDQSEDYIAYYKKDTPVYGGYSYRYNRVNEGIEYPYNSIYGSVDGITGKIYSYGSNWDYKISFESPKGAISPEKAMDYYLGMDGFGLKYEINAIHKYDNNNSQYYNPNSTEYEVRLVYRPDINPSYISPFTGEQLDYDGKVYKKEKPYTYLDITDAEKYRDVMLLSDMNIGFEGEYFKPEAPITIGEMNKLLEKVGYYGINSDTNYQESQLITREEVAQLFINKLGLEKVSAIKGVYKTGYQDESNIQQKYLGAVALAKGLGLMEGDKDNKFNAKSNVTRLDAVTLILNFIKVQQNGVLY